MATAAVIGVLGVVVIPVPALTSRQGVLLPVALLTPLMVSSVLAWGLGAGDLRLESVSARPLSALDVAWSIGLVVLTAVAYTIVGAITDMDLGRAAARNVVGFVGLMLIARRLMPRDAAPLTPVVYTLVVAAFGGTASGEARWWAWMIADPNDGGAIVWALCLLGAGAIVEVNRRGIT